MALAELHLDLDDFPGKVSYTKVTIDTDRARRPLMERAGIIDFNRAFDLMPSALIRSLGINQNIGTFHRLYPFLFEMKTTVSQALNYRESRVSSLDGQCEHFLFPLLEGGFIDRIAKSKLFSREFGVGALGILPNYPLPNPQSRGDHSIYITVDMIRSLQEFQDHSPDVLEQRLRRDFAHEPFYTPTMTQSDLFSLATDLVVLTGMEHDQATPAGGDTIKYLLGLHEEDDIDWLFFGEHNVLAAEREEFLQVLRDQGLGQDHLRFAIKCIQGKSTSLIGDMIHPHQGDQIDWDRSGYTRLDCEAARMLSNEIPTRLIGSRLTPRQNHLLHTSLSNGIDALNAPVSAVLGIPNYDPATGERQPNPSNSLIDPTPDYRLDSDGCPVNTNPERLAWTAAFRIFMVALHYAGGKMLGVETKLQRKLKSLLSQGKGVSVLNRENLVSVTTSELFQQLSDLKDPELTAIIDNTRNVVNSQQYASAVLPASHDASTAWAKYPLKVKPGLDSPVQDNGQVKTLREFLQDNPHLPVSSLIQQGIKAFQDRQVVIWEVDSEQGQAIVSSL